MPIIIPHTSDFLPAPPVSQTASQVEYWTRGQSGPVMVEQLRVTAIIRILLPYVKFAPRDGSGGWPSRPAGFGEAGWGYANMLDILDDLVADLALIQPNMSQCVALDPASDTVVNSDVAEHLQGFLRSSQLLFQYALNVARTVSLATVRAYNPAAFPPGISGPTATMAIIIPHTTTFLPQPPSSQSMSQIAYWNRGSSEPANWLEALRVMAVIRRLLPYVAFAPRGDGGWAARSTGFHKNSLGWGYANTLDILDDLVSDLSVFQPSMLQCAAVDPSSDIAVDLDVAQHLPAFCRTAQLLLQYALTVARTASLTAVRSYNPAAFPAA